MINDNDEVQWAYLLDPTFELVNTAGKPLTDGYIEVYIHGTRSKYYCASDWTGTLHPFKIPLDSLGANIVLASPAHAYDVYVYNKFGSLVMSRYNVVPATSDGSVIKDVVTITSEDRTVDVTTSDQTNWDLSIKDTVDRIDEHDIVLTELATDIDAINDDLSTKKDKQTALSFDGAATMTVKKITQNDNGVINVEFEDIDLPQEVPNVEITSPNGTINVQSSTDVETNTKTFTIDVNSQDVKYWKGKTSDFTLNRIHNGQYLHTILSGSGNLTPTNLSAGLYLVTASFDVYPSNVTNELLQFTYVFSQDRGTYEIDCSIPEDSLSNRLSYEHVEISNIINIQSDYTTPTLYFGLNFPTTTNNTLNFTCHNFAIFKLDNYIIAGGLDKVYHDATLSGDGTSDSPLTVVNGSGGGTTYTAGDAIDLTNNSISVKYGKGLEITTDNKLQLKVGKGLTIDNDTLEVTIDNSVGEVVDTVEKLQDDLDKKITTTYPFAQITTMSDFAVYGVTNTSRMIGQLFAVPIASEIRKDETLLCVNALQNFNGNVSFGIFEYDFAANNGTGSTYWIADTGTVSIQSGENKFKLKNVLNNNYELKSSMLYYAVVAIAGNAPVSGLMMGSSPAYSQNVNANPKYTIIVSNMDQAIDWNNGTLQGAYFQGYNEQYDIPRLFMMLRNGEGSTPIPVIEPFTDIGPFTLEHQYRVSNLFSMIPDAEGAVYRKVIPAKDVDISSFRYVDYHGSVRQQSSYPVLLDDTYTSMKTIGDGSWTLGNSDMTKIDGKYYVHEFTFTTPVHLTANTAYWFMVGGNMNKLGDEWIITYKTPTVTNDLLLVKNMDNVNQWIIPNEGEYKSAKPGMYLRLSDGTKNWVI